MIAFLALILVPCLVAAIALEIITRTDKDTHHAQQTR